MRFSHEIGLDERMGYYNFFFEVSENVAALSPIKPKGTSDADWDQRPRHSILTPKKRNVGERRSIQKRKMQGGAEEEERTLLRLAMAPKARPKATMSQKKATANTVIDSLAMALVLVSPLHTKTHRGNRAFSVARTLQKHRGPKEQCNAKDFGSKMASRTAFVQPPKCRTSQGRKPHSATLLFLRPPP